MDKRKEVVRAQPTDGRYFKRFLPLELKEAYDSRVEDYLSKKNPKLKWYNYKWHAALVVLALFVSGWFVNQHWYDFLKPMDLSEAEFHGLPKDQHRIAAVSNAAPPTLSRLLPELRELEFVLLSTSREEMPGALHSLATVATDHWSRWLKDRKISMLRCELAKWPGCARKASKRIIVLLPGEWDTGWLDQLAADGERFILYGAPIQALSSEDAWKWSGLEISHAQRNTWPHLALSGDQALTLGFDAGQQLSVIPISNRFRAVSDAPQAYAVAHDRVIGGPLDARLHAFAKADGRGVWMDFSPNVKDQPPETDPAMFDSLVASVMRYLLRHSYSAIATWPEAKPFGAFIGFTTDEDYTHTSYVRSMMALGRFPLTWFLVSDFMQRERRLSRQLAAVGEISCAADSRLSLMRSTLEEQIRRLARCRKVLNHLTGSNPTGIHPPEEHFNDETANSLINTGMKYLYARGDFDRAVPVIRRVSGARQQFVQLMRLTSDDYQLLSTLGLGLEEARDRIFNELEWVRSLGGLYSYSFTSRYADNEAYLRLVGDIAKRLGSRGAYFQTAAEISNWWLSRDALVSGQTLDRDLMAKYHPKRLVVSESGTLRTEDL
jgi:peptidoglycan/xylan/chitin deacetylase (PgdA/CDA1 family)